MPKGKLVVVFGAGGDRDPGKRPLMGEAAHDNADRLIVTDDNPRSERPRRDPQGGARRRARTPTRSATAARRSARRSSALKEGDILLIAGKGHETGQTVGDKVLPFSDQEEARAALQSVGRRRRERALDDGGLRRRVGRPAGGQRRLQASPASRSTAAPIGPGEAFVAIQRRALRRPRLRRRRR